MKRPFRYLLILLFLVCYSRAEDKNTTYDQLTRAGLDYAYNLQTDKATEIFHRLIDLEAKNPRGYVLQSINYFYRMQWQESKALDKKFKKFSSQAIKVAKKNLSNQETRLDALFYLGTTNIYLAAYHASQNNWLRAYWYGKDGIKNLERVIAADSTYYDAYLGLGLYHYYAAVIPKFIKSVAALLGIEGDRSRGLQELQLAAANGTLSRAEALLFLGNIYLYTEKETEQAMLYSTKLAELFPANPGFWSFLGENYQKAGKHLQAIQAFNKALQQKPVRDFPIFKILTLYNLGNAHYELNDFEQAINFYAQVLQTQAAPGDLQQAVQALSNYKIGLCLELQNRHEEAPRYYRAVRKSQHKEAYKQAQKKLKDPLAPVEKDLIIGRNFVRTKHYDKAVTVFELAVQKCEQNGENGYPEDKIPELRYNLAKTAFEMKKYEQAIAGFDRVLALKDVEDDWIKPWSHFYRGRCYEELGQYPQAVADYDNAHKHDDNELQFRVEKRKKGLQSKSASVNHSFDRNK
ncbi:MAG: tetratricopeptide repeat protein [bacterium]